MLLLIVPLVCIGVSALPFQKAENGELVAVEMNESEELLSVEYTNDILASENIAIEESLEVVDPEEGSTEPEKTNLDMNDVKVVVNANSRTNAQANVNVRTKAATTTARAQIMSLTNMNTFKNSHASTTAFKTTLVSSTTKRPVSTSTTHSTTATHSATKTSTHAASVTKIPSTTKRPTPSSSTYSTSATHPATKISTHAASVTKISSTAKRTTPSISTHSSTHSTTHSSSASVQKAPSTTTKSSQHVITTIPVTHTVVSSTIHTAKAVPTPVGYSAPQYGVDYPGNDLPKSTSSDCFTLCQSNPLCVAVVIIISNPQSCWLKSALGEPVLNSGMAIYIPSTVYADVQTGISYKGGDIAKWENGECYALCSTNKACIAVEVVNDKPLVCWMKGSLGKPTFGKNTNFTMKADVYGPPSTGLDYLGNNIEEFFNGECPGVCQSDPNCIAFVEVTSNINHCWTKSALGHPTPNADRTIKFRTFGYAKIGMVALAVDHHSTSTVAARPTHAITDLSSTIHSSEKKSESTDETSSEKKEPSGAPRDILSIKVAVEHAPTAAHQDASSTFKATVKSTESSSSTSAPSSSVSSSVLGEKHSTAQTTPTAVSDEPSSTHHTLSSTNSDSSTADSEESSTIPTPSAIAESEDLSVVNSPSSTSSVESSTPPAPESFTTTSSSSSSLETTHVHNGILTITTSAKSTAAPEALAPSKNNAADLAANDTSSTSIASPTDSIEGALIVVIVVLVAALGALSTFGYIKHRQMERLIQELQNEKPVYTKGGTRGKAAPAGYGASV